MRAAIAFKWKTFARHKWFAFDVLGFGSFLVTYIGGLYLLLAVEDKGEESNNIFTLLFEAFVAGPSGFAQDHWRKVRRGGPCPAAVCYCLLLPAVLVNCCQLLPVAADCCQLLPTPANVLSIAASCYQ